MAKTKEQKAAIIEKIEKSLKDGASSVFVHFTKVTVAEESAMRRALRGSGVSYFVAKKTLIRRALDKLGLKMPATTEEFYQVLKAFRTRDPNGNAKQDEIPFTFTIDGTTTGWAPFFGPFGILDYSSPKTPLSEHVNVQNGKIVFVPADPRYREAIQYFNRLYREGLIDQEVFTQNASQRRAKEMSQDNLVGVLIAWTVRGGVGTKRTDQFVQLPPLTGPRGDRLWIQNNSGRIQKNMFSVFSSCPAPEVMMRWVDEFYDQEFAAQVFYGPIGINMEKTADGKLKLLEPPPGMSAEDFKWTHTTGDLSPLAVLKETEAKMIPMSQALEKWEHYRALEPFLPKEIYPNVWHTQKEAEEINVLLTDIDSYAKKKQAEWVMQGGIERDWDDYLKQLDKMGLPRLVQIYVQAYERYVKG